MLNKFIFILTIFFSNLLFTPVSYAVDSDEQVEEILSQKNPPTGIVFEIVTGDATSLEWAVPEVKNHIKALRKRVPKLEIAIVTHGSEQFALQKIYYIHNNLVVKGYVELPKYWRWSSANMHSEIKVPNIFFK